MHLAYGLINEEQIVEAEEEYLELIKKIAENELGRKPLSVEFVG